MEPALFKKEDYSGKIIGGYQIICGAGKKYFSEKSWHYMWKVVCIGCGETKIIQSQHVRESKIGCYSCKGRKQSGSSSVHWRGGIYVPSYFVAQVKSGCIRKSKTLEYNLSIDYLDNLWIQQKQTCKYTGWPLNFGDNATEQTASLDRIDSSRGYVEGNVQFVHKQINLMKWSLSEERFLEICRTVSQYEK